MVTVPILTHSIAQEKLNHLASEEVNPVDPPTLGTWKAIFL